MMAEYDRDLLVHSISLHRDSIGRDEIERRWPNVPRFRINADLRALQQAGHIVCSHVNHGDKYTALFRLHPDHEAEVYGEIEYEMYFSNRSATWADVGAALAMAPGQAHKRAERYATVHGLIWGRNADMNGAEAFQLRGQGMAWPEIADRLGFNSRQAAQSSAQRWANRQKLKMPETKIVPARRTMAQAAYERRAVTGHGWKEIAAHVGTTSDASAIVSAKRYALDNGLPWPVPTRNLTNTQETA